MAFKKFFNLCSQGLKDEVEEGTMLGTFRYNEDGEPTQTFELPVSFFSLFHLQWVITLTCDYKCEADVRLASLHTH